MATGSNIGHVTQVIGSTFDVEYEEGKLPAIYNAVLISSNNKGVEVKLTGEVQQHLGGGRVRCVALGSTDGMVRGQDCVDTGKPVTVPVATALAKPRPWMIPLLMRCAVVDVMPSTRCAAPQKDASATATVPIAIAVASKFIVPLLSMIASAGPFVAITV